MGEKNMEKHKHSCTIPFFMCENIMWFATFKKSCDCFYKKTEGGNMLPLMKHIDIYIYGISIANFTDFMMIHP